VTATASSLGILMRAAYRQTFEITIESCGLSFEEGQLALAHARTGDPAMIAGYLGSSDAFDDAIVRFADSYADQTEQDYDALLKAMKSRRIKAR
jgi:hypothetical protein